MKLIKKIDFFKIFHLRFKGLRKEIKFLLILSTVSILSIEFCLNKFQAKYDFQYDFGVIYLKLCYSYFSSFLFYYIVVYTPRERKRIRTFRYLNNKILTIDRIVERTLLSLFREVEPNTNNLPRITSENIKDLCKQINPQSPVNLDGFQTFENHYEFLNFQTNKIKLLINELIILNEILDENLMKGLTNINDIITNHLSFDISYGNKDMDFLSHSLNDLYFEIVELKKYLLNNYRKRYEYEYHKYERIRNQRKNS